MAYRNVQEWIKALEEAGELVRIREQISPRLEITEVSDRAIKAGGPALLFENVESGSGMPVLMNAFGSLERMCMVLGVKSLDDAGADINDFIEAEAPRGIIQKLKLLPKVKRLSGIFPRIVSSAPCQEKVFQGDDVDLEKLPVLKCWPDDGGPFITLPVVITRHPATGVRNVGMYRMQIFDHNTTGMHWHAHKDSANHCRIAAQKGERLPVSVVIGPDPITTFAATAPLPEGIDELLFSGFMRHGPVDVVRCKSNGLEVPAESQIVLEGYVDPREKRVEGPFGDHTGYYSLADEYPVFHVECITMRNDPVYPATIVGKPPMEDCFMAKATERIFLPLIKRTLPEIVDINLPFEGVFHNLAFISIDKRYPGHARKVMHALWGLGQMMFTKFFVILDQEVDVQNTAEVLWRLGNNVDPGRDTVIVDGPVDALDHAAPMSGYGSKMGIDATRKWTEEGFSREWPEVIVMDAGVKEKVDRIWKSLGIPGKGAG